MYRYRSQIPSPTPMPSFWPGNSRPYLGIIKGQWWIRRPHFWGAVSINILTKGSHDPKDSSVLFFSCFFPIIQRMPEKICPCLQSGSCHKQTCFVAVAFTSADGTWETERHGLLFFVGAEPLGNGVLASKKSPTSCWGRRGQHIILMYLGMYLGMEVRIKGDQIGGL